MQSDLRSSIGPFIDLFEEVVLMNSIVREESGLLIKCAQGLCRKGVLRIIGGEAMMQRRCRVVLCPGEQSIKDGAF